jgi:L-fuconolactonase
MPPFPIVDTHLHLWDTRRLRYPWLDTIPLLDKPFGLADFHAASAGLSVEKIVFLQAECIHSQFIAEVELISEYARDEPRIQGIVAWAPLEHGAAVRSDLAVLSAYPLVRGVRRILVDEDPAWWVQPGFVRGLQALADFGLSFDLCASHRQLASAAELARRCPEVSIVLDHIGNPDIAGGGFEPWANDLRALASLPNVWCKVSGVATGADHRHWTREQLRPYLSHVLDCFGFERAMFGSDWPVALQAIAYPQWVEVLEWAVSGCSAQEQRRLFRDSAVEFYRL